MPKTDINKECTLYFGVMGATENGSGKTSSILSQRIARGVISADTEVLSPSTDVWLQILANYEFALNRLADMNNTLADMDNRLEVIDNRIIESAQENKANINLNNLTNDATNVMLSRINMDNLSNGNNQFKAPYKIRCGKVTTVISNSWATANVVFDKAYTDAPIVVATCEKIATVDNAFPFVFTKNITENGFEVSTHTQAGGSMVATVHWIAMGV